MTRDRPKYVAKQRIAASDWRNKRITKKRCPQCNKRRLREGKKTCAVCGRRMSQQNCEKSAKDRDIVLAHYGQRCVKCGETTKEFLQVDHVNNDGTAHRNAVGIGKTNADIIKRGFPSEFQILCVDCNAEKRDQVKAAQHLAGLQDPTVPDRVKARRTRDVARYAAIRDQVFDHYGRSCDCCESTRVLHIDHVTGGGSAHRRELKAQSVRFYDWLVKQGLPEGYRTLCAKCNWSKGRYGYCPHDTTNFNRERTT
jgi:hypothetical protein